MEKQRVSDAVIRRLPRYYRQLSQLEREGVLRISSGQLSRLMSLTASQIRHDLNCFGGFGQQGYGYSVKGLKSAIADILELGQQKHMIIIGAGNIGQALACYEGFPREGFYVHAIFDNNPRLIGKTVGRLQVSDIQELEIYLAAEKVNIAVVATPGEFAQQTADRLTACGVRAIWNFAPIDVAAPNNVVVENVSLSDSLYALSYFMNQLDEQA